MTDRATISVVPFVSGDATLKGFGITIDGAYYKENGRVKTFYSESEANSKADSLATESKAGERRFVDGKCRYCGEPESQHLPDMCGYDKCKGQSCDKWIHRPQNPHQLCDECLLKYIASLESRLASTPAQAQPTFESERAALVAEVGECCMGSDPLCSGGCLVERALRKRQVTAPTAQPQAVVATRTFKPCKSCGYDNEDTYLLCRMCGKSLTEQFEAVAPEPLYEILSKSHQPAAEGREPNQKVLQELSLNALKNAAMKIAYAWERSRDEGALEVKLLIDNARKVWAHNGDSK